MRSTTVLTLAIAVAGLVGVPAPALAQATEITVDHFAERGTGNTSFLATKPAATVQIVTAGLLATSPEHLAVTAELTRLDAVGLGPRDISDAGTVNRLRAHDSIPFVSANVRHEGIEIPRHVVREVGTTRVAITSVCSPSEGPVSGWIIEDPELALDTVLPSMAAADVVVVLAAMDPLAAGALLSAFPSVDVVLTPSAGTRDPQPLRLGELVLVRSPVRPGSFGRLVLRSDGRRWSTLSSDLVVPERTTEDLIRIREVSVREGRSLEPSALLSPAKTPGEATTSSPSTGRPASLEIGRATPLRLAGQNRAARLELSSMALASSHGGCAAPDGCHWLILHGSWTNIIPMTWVFEREASTAYLVPTLRDHLYVVVDGERVARLDAALTAGPGGLGKLALPYHGSTLSGDVFFPIGAAPPRSLELRFYDYAHGHIVLPLLEGELEASEALLPVVQNEFLDLGVFGYRRLAEWNGDGAPAGMTYVEVDLRGRSRFTFESDATAFDPHAARGATMQIGTVADWKESREYLQLVVDGEHASLAEDASPLPPVPRFLPDLLAGERAVFLVPKPATSVELHCEFPRAQAPGKSEIVRPEALHFVLEGTPPAPPTKAGAPLLTIDDEVFRVSVLGQALQTHFAGEAAGADRAFRVLDIAVDNVGSKIECFQTTEQLRYATESGGEVAMDTIGFRGPRRPIDRHWIPQGARRSFQVVFRVPEGETVARLAYRGLGFAKHYELPAEPLVEGPVAAAGTPRSSDVARKPPAPEPVDTARPKTPSPPPPGVAPTERPAGLASLEGDTVPGFTPVTGGDDSVELAVLDVRLAERYADVEAPEGNRILVLQTRWRRRDASADWRAGYLAEKVFLLRRGLFLEKVWGSAWSRTGFIPRALKLTDEQPEVIGNVAFTVSDQDLAGSALVFAPDRGPSVVVPFLSAREAVPAIVARGKNDVIQIAVHGFVEPTEEMRRIIGADPPGRTLVGLRVAASSIGRSHDIADLPYHWPLIVGGSFPCPSYPRLAGREIDGWPVWGQQHRLYAGVADHGVLLYSMPEGALSLALEVFSPTKRDPKASANQGIVLPLRTGADRSTPKPLVTIEEKGWALRVLGVRRHESHDKPYVVIDVALRAPADLELRPLHRGEITVLDQSGRAQTHGTLELPFEPAQYVYFPPGRWRRMDLCLLLTDLGSRLWLRAPKRFPTSEVYLPNPWVAVERRLLVAREPLSVSRIEGEKPVYSPPPLFPEPDPKGIESVGLTGQQVNEAIRKGAEYLIDRWQKRAIGHRERESLVILALLHSGELAKHPKVQTEMIDCLATRAFCNTYDTALTAMALEVVDPGRFRPRIQRITQAFVDGQGAGGGWGYLQNSVLAIEPGKGETSDATGPIDVIGGEPILGWPGSDREPVVLERQSKNDSKSGDNSCSQYAVLGLQAAAEAGVRVPAQAWHDVVKFYLGNQVVARGWSYGSYHATGSMTTAGLTVIAIARHHLAGAGDDVTERPLRVGVDWLARNLELDRNPNSGVWHYYYLYGLERAGQLLGKEFFGEHEWYPLGARYLVDNQAPSGSWSGTCGKADEILDTAFALLFLTRATEKLGVEEVVDTGPGKLKLIAPGLSGTVEFILDASGSMTAALGTETRFDAARRSILTALEGGGADLEVALRAYGHRYRANHKDANRDSELVVGFGAADRPELAAALGKLRCRGKTPLTYSLEQSLLDLRESQSDRKRVVLLTDGLESDRRAKPVAAAAALGEAQIRLDVVCLAVEKTALLESMAAAGGGACYRASDADELLAAFRQALSGEGTFRVLDPEGREVGHGKSGDEVELPAGPYTVTVDIAGKNVEVNAWVHAGRTTELRVRPEM